MSERVSARVSKRLSGKEADRLCYQPGGDANMFSENCARAGPFRLSTRASSSTPSLALFTAEISSMGDGQLGKIKPQAPVHVPVIAKDVTSR